MPRHTNSYDCYISDREGDKATHNRTFCKSDVSRIGCVLHVSTHSAIGVTSPAAVAGSRATVVECGAPAIGSGATAAGSGASAAGSSASAAGSSASAAGSGASATGTCATAAGSGARVAQARRVAHGTGLLHHEGRTRRLGLRRVTGHQTYGCLLGVICALTSHSLLLLLHSPTVLHNSINKSP